MYNVIDISKYIISMLNEVGVKITNLKLQKMLYYAQAYSLLEKDKPLYEEDIVARKLGPIVPVAHNAFKWANSSEILVIEEPNEIIEKRDKEMIKEVLMIMAYLPSEDLVNITNEYDTWKDAIINTYDRTIYNDEIKKYHKKRMAESGYYF